MAVLGERLAEAARRDRVQVRTVPFKSVHLTLAFLGDVRAELREQIERALASAAASAGGPISLAARGAGAFPSPTRPRVLWAGLSGDQAALAALHAAVAAALEPLGFEPEKRELKPHLTVGRVSSPRPAPSLAAALREAADLALGEWTARELRLYQSELRPSGAVYTVRAAWPLGRG